MPPSKYQRGRFRSPSDKCPFCGEPRSHGLQGNPNKRSVPPCIARERARLVGSRAPHLERYRREICEKQGHTHDRDEGELECLLLNLAELSARRRSEAAIRRQSQ